MVQRLKASFKAVATAAVSSALTYAVLTAGWLAVFDRAEPPLQACSARPLVLRDGCGGFEPLRFKSATIDYLERNDPRGAEQLAQQYMHGEAVCGWRR
jgi:hypothetical protein